MQRLLRRHWFIGGLCLIFLIATCWMSARWYNHTLNPDAMPYFGIAKKYAHGDIRHAVNGYWSPLLSWLLIPAVWLHMDLLVAAKWINSLAAVAMLAIAYIYLVRHRVNQIIVYGSCFILANLLSLWVVSEPITPDLVEALFIVAFAITLVSFLHAASRQKAYTLGAIGAGMYYTKSMGFFLFLVTILSVALWEYLRSRPRTLRPVFDRYKRLLALFLLLVFPFIFVISLKYHRPAINNAGVYDWNVYGIHGQGVQPIDSLGPVAPPNPTAITAWEDPTFLAPQKADWNPLQSRAAFSWFFEKMWWPNFNAIFSILRGFGAYAAFAFIVLLLGCLRPSLYRQEFVIFSLITAIALFFYLIIFLDGRYMWGETALAIIATAPFISQLLEARAVTRLQLLVAVIIIGGSMLLGNLQFLTKYRHEGQDEYDAGLALQTALPAGSRVISDQSPQTFPICYQLQLHCYGVLTPSPQNSNYDQLLKRFGITYFLDLHTRDNDSTLQSFILDHAQSMQDWRVDDMHFTLYRLY